MTSDLFWEIT